MPFIGRPYRSFFHEALMTYVVEMLNISKQFPGVRANDNVTLQVNKGEIHALIGENGAGKTTLMSILYGLYQPDSGEIRLDDKAVHIVDPQTAIQHGIGMVHQHFMLVPSLTVAENVVLGRTPTNLLLTNTRSAEAAVRDISQKYGLTVDPRARIYELSVGQMQRVEIIKALYRHAEILILDEPTAVLTPQETRELFKIIQTLAEQGRTIIFISHKLKEVRAISQRVTVMRQGKVTGRVNTSETNEAELARLMVGRDVVLQVKRTPGKPSSDILRLESVSAFNDRGLPALCNVSFNVRLGEILGVAGVEGNGQTELVEVITGLRDITAGKICLHDRDVAHSSPRKRREQGIAHIPEDRLLRGVSRGCSIEENLIVNTYYRRPLSRSIMFNMAQVGEFAQGLIERFNVMTPSKNLPVRSLSGGNMQKVVLAREIAGEPDLLVAAQPTRGVDVGAIEYIHQQLLDLRDRGHGILLVSAELEEIMILADRIVVMYEGEIVGEFAAGQVAENELGLYMAGAKRMSMEAAH
jgi:general nucleoside transport system ATP-binding protein